MIGVSKMHSLVWFVTEATYLLWRQAPNKKAMPIAIAKSANTSAYCRNYYGRPVLDASLTPLPPESNSMQCGTRP